MAHDSKKKEKRAIKAVVRAAEKRIAKPAPHPQVQKALGRTIHRTTDPFRAALWQTYYPRLSRHGSVSVRNSLYDAIPTRWSDVTTYQVDFAGAPHQFLMGATQTNVCAFRGVSAVNASVIPNTAVEVDRQVPVVVNGHQWYVDTFTMGLRMTTGNLTELSGVVRIGQVLLAETWDVQNSVAYSTENVSTFPGIHTFTFQEILAGKCPQITFSRVGPGADTSMECVNFELPPLKVHRRRYRGKFAPPSCELSKVGAEGDGYQHLKDCLVPFIDVVNTGTSATLEVTITRAGEILYRPDDNINDMPGVRLNNGHVLNPDGVKRLNQLMGHAPVVPNVSSEMDAQKVIDQLANFATGALKTGVSIMESPTTQAMLGLGAKLFGAVLL